MTAILDGFGESVTLSITGLQAGVVIYITNAVALWIKPSDSALADQGFESRVEVNASEES